MNSPNFDGFAEVLLLDRHAENARFVTRLLENSPAGFRVTIASSLRQGLQLLHAGGFAAVVADLDLPDSQGMETLLKIRNEFAQVPVVILASAVDHELGVRAIECGAQDFVAKEHIWGELITRAVRFAIARNKQILYYKSAARTDALTGLPNRRALDEQLQRVHAEFIRHEQSYCLMMLDIDHFKQVNDAHGHRFGDFVLTELGKLLGSHFRQTDFVARYGGEEFALILTHSRLAEAAVAARRLLRDTANFTMQLEGIALRVNVSIGIAEAVKSQPPEEILHAADEALYEAKRQGRNRACYRQEGSWLVLAAE